jgi:hypothetical protein
MVFLLSPSTRIVWMTLIMLERKEKEIGRLELEKVVISRKNLRLLANCQCKIIIPAEMSR